MVINLFRSANGQKDLLLFYDTLRKNALLCFNFKYQPTLQYIKLRQLPFVIELQQK